MDPREIGVPPVVTRFLDQARGAGWLSAAAMVLVMLAALQITWIASTLQFPCAEICTRYCAVRAGQLAGDGGWLGGHSPASFMGLAESLSSASAVVSGLLLGAALCYLVASARFGQALAELLGAEGWPGLRRALAERAGPFPVAFLVFGLPGPALALLGLVVSALLL